MKEFSCNYGQYWHTPSSITIPTLKFYLWRHLKDTMNHKTGKTRDLLLQSFLDAATCIKISNKLM